MASQADHEQKIAAALEASLRQATGLTLRLGAGVQRMTGGFDTETYAFRLEDAPETLSGDLVLRLFRGVRESHRVSSEAAIQNQPLSGSRQLSRGTTATCRHGSARSKRSLG
jgi:hypothetical protein